MGAGGLSLAFFASVFWPGLTRSPVSALVGPIGWVWVHLPLFFLTSHNIHFMTQSAAKLDRTSVSSPVRARPPLAFASFLGGAARTSSALCFRWYFAILLWLFFIIGFYENIFRAINLTICQTPCTQLFHQPGGEEDVINPRPPLPTKKWDPYLLTPYTYPVPAYKKFLSPPLLFSPALYYSFRPPIVYISLYKTNIKFMPPTFTAANFLF